MLTIPTTSKRRDYEYENTQEVNEFESQDDDIKQNTNELNKNQPLDITSIDLIIDDLTDFVIDNTITRENVSFFQKSLTSFLSLFNIMNKTIQIPTTFYELVSLLNSINKNLNYQKSWYCGMCQQLFQKLKRSFST